jgi:hypothetical protein
MTPDELIFEWDRATIPIFGQLPRYVFDFYKHQGNSYSLRPSNPAAKAFQYFNSGHGLIV